MIVPEGVPREFEAFVDGMAIEYNRHRAENGDSWTTATPWYLNQLLSNSYEQSLNKLTKNPSHLLDIANFCWFLWYRLKETESEVGL